MNRPAAVPDLIFDVGMHLGEDTAFYLAKGFRVVAFEANPVLVAANQRRFEQQMEAGEVVIVEGAITETNDSSTVSFYRHPTVSVWGTTKPQWVDRNDAGEVSEALEVDAVDFSRELRRHGVPWFLKIDIEGADRACLSALSETPAKPAFVSIESEKVNFDALRAELDLLEDLGYDRFAAVQQAGRDGRMIRSVDRLGNPVNLRLEPHSSGPFGSDIKRWTDRATVEAKYRAIFRRYRAFGDAALVNRLGITCRARAELEMRVKRPLPGWYDTHATTRALVG